MSFNQGDIDYETSSGFGPYEATVTKAGVAHGKYGPQLIFVCQPTNPQRRAQTLFMSMGKGEYVFGGESEAIITGDGENAFQTLTQTEIVEGPKINILTNAGLFLNALKHLGFEVVGGDMTIYLGLKLDLEEVSQNEAIQRFNALHPDTHLDERTGNYAKGKITMPVKIIEMPAKKIPLKDQVLDFVSTEKTENEVIEWSRESGATMKDIFANLDVLKEDGSVVFDGKTYMAKKKNE